MSQRSDRIKELAETVFEKALAWQISLPPPFTFVTELVKYVVAVAVGVWLGR